MLPQRDATRWRAGLPVAFQDEAARLGASGGRHSHRRLCLVPRLLPPLLLLLLHLRRMASAASQVTWLSNRKGVGVRGQAHLECFGKEAAVRRERQRRRGG